MKLLLHEELAPLTTDIAFFQASFEDVWKATLKFRTNAFSNAKFKRTVKAKEISGDLKAVIKGLLPFCNLITRHLIIEGDNGWVAYFNNSFRGDFGAIYFNLPPLLNCDAVTIQVEPRTLKKLANSNRSLGRFGIIEFALYAPFLFERHSNVLRRIRILGEDVGYEFYEEGQPQAFEQVEAYNKRRVEDRLTFDMLKSYCEALGIRPFDEDFYNPRKAMLIDEYGKLPPHRNFSLEEAWQDFDPK